MATARHFVKHAREARGLLFSVHARMLFVVGRCVHHILLHLLNFRDLRLGDVITCLTKH